jgi:hypothetical protein
VPVVFSSCLGLCSIKSYHRINLKVQQLQMMHWSVVESSYVFPCDVMPSVTVTSVLGISISHYAACLMPYRGTYGYRILFSEFIIFIIRPTITCSYNPFWHKAVCYYAKCRPIANRIMGCRLTCFGIQTGWGSWLPHLGLESCTSHAPMPQHIPRNILLVI